MDRLRATLRWAGLVAIPAICGLLTGQQRLPQLVHVFGLVACVFLLRRIGRLRSWVSASALTIAGMTCVVAFVVNNPTTTLDIVVSLVAMGLLLPVVIAVAARRPSVPAHPRDDALGAVSRLSPPLLGAVLLSFVMYMLSLILGSHDPAKLVGGLGVVLLFGGGIIASPAMLIAAGKRVESRWRSGWYGRQLAVAERLRIATVVVHRVATCTQVLLASYWLGHVTAGTRPPAGLVVVQVWLFAVGASLVAGRMRRAWAPVRAGAPPITAGVLGRHAQDLALLGGPAFALGSVLSLVALLAS